MNIAILICGQWRTGNKCFNNIIQNIIIPLQKNNNTIFIFITTDYTNIKDPLISTVYNYIENKNFQEFDMENDEYFL